MSTVLGSSAPPLSVKLMQVFSSGSKDASVLKQVIFEYSVVIHEIYAILFWMSSRSDCYNVRTSGTSF